MHRCSAMPLKHRREGEACLFPKVNKTKVYFSICLLRYIEFFEPFRGNDNIQIVPAHAGDLIVSEVSSVTCGGRRTKTWGMFVIW